MAHTYLLGDSAEKRRRSGPTILLLLDPSSSGKRIGKKRVDKVRVSADARVNKGVPIWGPSYFPRGRGGPRGKVTKRISERARKKGKETPFLSSSEGRTGGKRVARTAGSSRGIRKKERKSSSLGMGRREGLPGVRSPGSTRRKKKARAFPSEVWREGSRTDEKARGGFRVLPE